jgi:hypothetical protein
MSSEIQAIPPDSTHLDAYATPKTTTLKLLFLLILKVSKA